MERKLSAIIDRVLEKPFEAFIAYGFTELETTVEGKIITICPVTKNQDNFWLKIVFIPNASGMFIEHETFGVYISKLQQMELGLEGCCNMIFEDIIDVCKPTRLTVEVSSNYRFLSYSAKRTTDFLFRKKS